MPTDLIDHAFVADSVAGHCIVCGDPQKLHVEAHVEARLELAREGAVANLCRVMGEMATKKRNQLIVQLYATREYTQKELAHIANVSQSSVTDILRH